MFKIDGFSLLRAGALGAAIAGLLYLMSLTPFFNTILTVMLIAGGVLIPLGTGMYYGYLAPGEETMFQSVVGGAISGLIVGLILGLAFGLNAFVMSTASSFLGSLASGVGTSLIIGGIFGAIGAVLGALGGVIWKVIQPPEPAQE
ncbi:MAG: hypothetical protein ACK2T4_09200 [Candidatus Promineifilaceae bacterium]|jgi:hypothetical protein